MVMPVKTHQQIDRRSLAMAQRIVARIDEHPELLEHVQGVLRRWTELGRDTAEWEALLQRPWSEVREILLDASEEGARLRQSDPFCGILSSQERLEIYREFRDSD